jgi:hypothetical protein
VTSLNLSTAEDAEDAEVEVDEQSDAVPTEFEIRHQLSQMERQQFLHCLQFDDDAIFDEKVDAISSVESYVLINDRKFYLMTEFKSVGAKLIGETRLVSAFQTSRAESTVDFDGCRDDLFCQRVVDHRRNASASPASSAVACLQVTHR